MPAGWTCRLDKTGTAAACAAVLPGPQPCAIPGQEDDAAATHWSAVAAAECSAQCFTATVVRNCLPAQRKGHTPGLINVHVLEDTPVISCRDCLQAAHAVQPSTWAVQ